MKGDKKEKRKNNKKNNDRANYKNPMPDILIEKEKKNQLE